MAVNQKLENTSKAPNRSSQGPRVGCSAMYSATLASLRLRWGSSAPGIAASANRNSNTSAVPIDVSVRQVLRAFCAKRVHQIGNLTSLTNASRTHETKSFHTPVTSARPTRINSTPPKI